MSNDNAQYIEELEAQKAGHQKAVEVGQRLERLCKDQDFRALVLQYWMVDEAARYASLSQDPALSMDPVQKEQIQRDCINMAAAPGHFKRWVEVQRQMAQTAANSIAEVDAELDRVRSEEDGE